MTVQNSKLLTTIKGLQPLEEFAEELQEELGEKNRSLVTWEWDWQERQRAGAVEMEEREREKQERRGTRSTSESES
jgi:hypothetical protein